MEAQPRNEPSTLCDGNEKHLWKPAAAALPFQGLIFFTINSAKRQFLEWISPQRMHLVSYCLSYWKTTWISAAPTERPSLLVARRQSVILCLSHLPPKQNNSNSKTTPVLVWLVFHGYAFTWYISFIFNFPMKPVGGGWQHLQLFLSLLSIRPSPKTLILTTLTNFNYCQHITISFALVGWFLPFPPQLPPFPNVTPAVEHNSEELLLSILPCTVTDWVTFIQGPFHCISVKESFWCKQQHINKSCIN